METLWKSLRKGSAWTEVDHVYENIEAPKFVDFAAPDRCCPDSRSWFCARIGKTLKLSPFSFLARFYLDGFIRLVCTASYILRNLINFN